MQWIHTCVIIDAVMPRCMAACRQVGSMQSPCVWRYRLDVARLIPYARRCHGEGHGCRSERCSEGRKHTHVQAGNTTNNKNIHVQAGKKV